MQVIKSNKKYIMYHSDTMNEDIYSLTRQIKGKMDPFRDGGHGIEAIMYLPRGGAVPATHLCHMLGVKTLLQFPQLPKLTNPIRNGKFHATVLLVDDISDTGMQLLDAYEYLRTQKARGNLDLFIKTATCWKRQGTAFDPDFCARTIKGSSRIVFPWETNVRPTRSNWLSDQMNCNLLGVV